MVARRKINCFTFLIKGLLIVSKLVTDILSFCCLPTSCLNREEMLIDLGALKNMRLLRIRRCEFVQHLVRLNQTFIKHPEEEIAAQ